MDELRVRLELKAMISASSKEAMCVALRELEALIWEDKIGNGHSSTGTDATVVSTFRKYDASTGGQ